MTGIALKELCDQDYMTQAARKYPNIPKGAEVECVSIVENLYGAYMKVRYDGIMYYVDPKYVSLK